MRAWRDSHRIVIRVLTAGGHTGPTDEWVFADIGEACDRVGEVLRELVDPGSAAARPDAGAAVLRNVDAATHHSPPE